MTIKPGIRRKAAAQHEGAKPEEVSPGCEAYWLRQGTKQWNAIYETRQLTVRRTSTRSPMLSAFIDGEKVFGRVRFLPVAQQRVEALVRLGLAPKKLELEH